MLQPARRLELLFLSALPALITLLLTLFYLASKHVGGLNQFMPILPLIPVFFWGMTHAREMPYWFVFALGIILDSLMTPVLGLSSLLYIFFLMLLHAQRKYIHKEGFMIKWGYFAALLAVICSLNWIALAILNARPESLFPGVLQWFFTVCCYPFMHKGFEELYEYISSRRWNILHGV
jgi:rod shape-determining protein MreD